MPMFKSFASAAVAPVTPPTNPDDATKQALLAVVQVWLDRLSAMSVVTSFFVSIDSMLYSFAASAPDSSDWSAIGTLIIASLGGAIILHVCASILAYCGSFVLIRYRLKDAEKTEKDTESGAAKPSVDTDRKQFRAGIAPLSPGPTLTTTTTPTEYVRDISWEAYTDLRSLISVSQIHPFAWLCGMMRKAGFRRDPETSGMDDTVVQLHSMVLMLTRVHTVTVIMTVLGFILALLGTVAYFWTGLPRALGIFASACLGGCIFASAIAVL
ncbi:hypothetical protein L226DRAFT_165161 [Lentinus tigrinus ALCF2SS1-7]|uniref:Transmembrane protein n=1 Tax=Lentinus tigrinus ALCF2SS1-6 TaxID=1328759 RepID=A0A5C2S482_9APHY|nr:hypothetical protein L227DRAFT_221947 [Lentinus tigrinus ALCF2SS1-6]RPD71915.1 hypothetical protein L226DRAFT_165161 [Lentinus tigrinus ALCF2SS1-7]